MVLPVMLIGYFGFVEVAMLIDLDHKATLLARSLADLTGRATSMDSSQMTAIFNAGTVVMAPYTSTSANVVVSSILVQDAGNGTVKGTVDWSCTSGSGASKRPTAPSPLPAGYQTAGTSFILAEVSVPYTPVAGWVLKSQTLSKTVPWPVRYVSQVPWSGSAC